MKVKISYVLAVCFILGLLPLTMNSQESEKPYQLFWVHDALVKPSMKTEYFEAGKKWIALLTKHEVPFAVNTFWTDDNHVMWSVPIESFADIDKLYGAMMKIEETAPDEFKSIRATYARTTYSSRICVYALDYEYSMIAEEAAAKSEGNNFTFFDIYYFEPYKETELYEIFDEMKALVKDKEILQSWYFYWGVMGTDNPVLWSAANAKNATAFYEENAKAWEILGQEASKIRQKLMKYVTKQERKTAWFQKELSYAPAKKEE
jgi:hypothetical protein